MDSLVSIVLPYYNGSRYVQETLDSIQKQTYKNFEVLIVDDGSPDSKESAFIRDAIAKLQDERFKYIHKTNGGLSDARNFGIDRAQGDWIAFIDQDDYWKPTKLERQMRVLSGSGDIEFVFSAMDMLPIQGGLYRHRMPSWCERDGIIKKSYERILHTNFVPASSVLFKKSLSAKAGYSKKSFSFCPDYELFVRMARVTDFYYIHEPLMVYRLHDAQTIRQKSKLYSEGVAVLFASPLSTFGEKWSATVYFCKLMAGLAWAWGRKLRDFE